MRTIEILYNLTPYQHVLEELFNVENGEQPEMEWSSCLKSSYDFIILELKRESKIDVKAPKELFLKISFQLRQNKAFLEELYCVDLLKQETLRSWVEVNKDLRDACWHSNPDNTWYHNEKVTAYINIADEIANRGLNCNPGDNYRPGFFSEIAIYKDVIILEQINHYNARSSDHKDNYQLRDLVLHIPLSGQLTVSEAYDYRIGEMGIQFSDRSSVNNKSCGQKIVEQILQQKANINAKK